MDTPTNAAIYCRLSYAPDGSLEKVERQEADCRQVARNLGWPISARHVYPDNSRSAWQRDRKRPAWDRMLADIEAGIIDAIIVYHGDRLIRQPWDLEQLLKLSDDRRLRLASVTGTRDLSDEDDRFVLRIEVAQACRESANTSRRVRRGWAARAEAGLPIGGGPRPFGFGTPTGRTGRTGKPIYDVTVQVPEEVAVIREAVDRIFAGETLGGVIRWMNTVSTTSQGERWAGQSLKFLLRSPRIAGRVAHQGTLYEAAWEPIVEFERWTDLQSLLDEIRDRHGYSGRERRYLLSGVAECSGCGWTLLTKPAGGRNRKHTRLYHCPNLRCSRRVGRNLIHLDAFVEGWVLRRLNEPSFLDSLHAENDLPDVAAEITALERRHAEARASLEALADHPEVDPALIAASMGSFTRRISDLRERRAASTGQRLLARMAGITLEAWRAEPMDVRVATVRALVGVIVLPTRRGPGFDPESVLMVPLTGGA